MAQRPPKLIHGNSSKFIGRVVVPREYEHLDCAPGWRTGDVLWAYRELREIENNNRIYYQFFTDTTEEGKDIADYGWTISQIGWRGWSVDYRDWVDYVKPWSPMAEMACNYFRKK